MAADPAPASPVGIVSSEVAWLKDEIDTFERQAEKFFKRGRKILKKYKDVRTPREDAITRYNILWANVQTRLPALYARNPKPVCERRYKDRDVIGRTAAEILERSLEYTIEHVNDFHYVMRNVVRDFELPGLGVVWVRYEPHFHKTTTPAAKDKKEPEEPQNEETRADGADVGNSEKTEPDEEGPGRIEYEETFVDYVNWEDFGHSWARTWDEVRLIWKRAYMDRDELLERFVKPGGKLTGEQVKSIPMDWSPKNLSDTQIKVTKKKAIVYEAIDKRTRDRYWLVKNFPILLDQRGDELGLTKVFPAPRPLIANEVSDELMPVPNFSFYQDQANEIDELSTRIVAISKALKVAGVRDSSAEGLERLLSEGVENMLVPVNAWAVHKEKGGLAGVMELLPLKDIAEALGYLREQRTQLIEDVYQITGIADIVRGFSDPDETATAQQLKGQFSMIRIEDSQREVQRFCRDVIRIVGEIVAGYDIETLKQISGVKLLTKEEKANLQVQLQMQQAAAQAQPPPQAGQPGQGAPQAQGQAPGPQGVGPGVTPAAGQTPLAPDKLRLMELPTWEEVAALLENPVYREFRLDIETDSTVAMDEEAEKKARIELITAVGGFLDKAVEAGMQAPEIVPMLGELLMYGIRAFKAARPIEQAFEDAMDALQKASQAPKPPPPEVQIQIAKNQAEAQLAQQKAQFDAQLAQSKAQAEEHRAQVENQMEGAREQHKIQLQTQLEQHKAQLDANTQMAVQEMKNQFEAQKVQYEGAIKLHIAELQHGADMKKHAMTLDHQAQEGEKQRNHEATEGQRGREHEKSLPKKAA